MALLVITCLLEIGNYFYRRNGSSAILLIPPVLCIIGLFQLTEWPTPLRVAIGVGAILYNFFAHKIDGTEKFLMARLAEQARENGEELDD